MVTISALKDFIRDLKMNSEDLMWAKVWDDTKRGIAWMDDLPSISPGRWAVGYNYLYVMTRVLNEKRPCNVLECGLGVSSTLFCQYFKGINIIDGCHDIIEQDSEWKRFYLNSNTISSITNIHLIECVEKVYKGKRINAYKDIKGVVEGKKYDVISIDGPWGSEFYSRIDVVEYLPDILNDSFIIIIDDTQRSGEKALIKEIEHVLSMNGVDYEEGNYRGVSQCTVIVSADNKFLCSL